MGITELFGAVVSYAKANPFIALAAAGILLFFFYRRPSMSIFILFIIALLAGVYYVIISMSSSSVSEKERLLEKSVPHEITSIDPSRMLR
jgi:hypothetical protein